MTTTFLLGNGFDVCLGLKTRYSEFYENHYIKLPRKDLAPYLKTFREEIEQYVESGSQKSGDDIDWADLEMALGQYSEKLTYPEEYIGIILDVNQELKNYIALQNRDIVLDEKKANKIVGDFCLPDSTRYLSQQYNSAVSSFKNSHPGIEEINFITFNYTETLEHIIKLGGSKSIRPNSAGYTTSLKEILHIHSHIKEDPAIIVGVNDKSQIANVKFRDNENVLDVIVKPRTNDMFGNGKNSQAEILLRSTDLYVIFGASIGDTDKKWWTMIGKELVNKDTRLLYFVYDNPGESNALLLGRRRREFEEKFMKAAGVAADHYQMVRSKIFVAYNTNIFK